MTHLGIDLAKGVVKYTKNGARLVSKTATNRTKTAIVETDFGRGLKFIEQHFDDNGKLTSTNILYQKDDKEVSFLNRIFSREGGQTNITTTYSDELVTTINEEKQRIITEHNGSKSLLRIKLSQSHLDKSSRYEEQAYEYLTNAKNKALKRTLYTTAERLHNGRLINKTVNGNLPNIDEIAKDPYLYIRNYSNEDFTKSASYIAAENQMVNRGDFINKELKDTTMGIYNDSRREVSVDPSKHANKSILVDTLNHEYRHKYQHEQIRKYFKYLFNFFRSKENKIIMSPVERKQALQFLKGDIFYTQPKKNYKKYLKNILEVDARKAGDIAETEYYNYTSKLAKAFHNEASIDFFGCPDKNAFQRFISGCKRVKTGIFDSTAIAAKA